MPLQLPLLALQLPLRALPPLRIPRLTLLPRPLRMPLPLPLRPRSNSELPKLKKPPSGGFFVDARF
jgi:hypothetical protein